jgi:hypothetical protein
MSKKVPERGGECERVNGGEVGSKSQRREATEGVVMTRLKEES